MSFYFCDRCGKPRLADEHGYHHGFPPGSEDPLEWCEDCHDKTLAAVVNAEEEFDFIDGFDMEEHFVCPECLGVLPREDMREFLKDEGGMVGVFFACRHCREKFLGPLED